MMAEMERLTTSGNLFESYSRVIDELSKLFIHRNLID